MQTKPPLRLLIVDDSALIRKVLANLFADEPLVEVVGKARDGLEAVEMARTLKPDVITLDVEMPGLSGLDAIPLILADRRVPIVMISTHTREGAEVTLEALERGAVDFVPKPERNQLGQIRESRDLIVSRVIAAARCRVKRPSSGRKTLAELGLAGGTGTGGGGGGGSAAVSANVAVESTEPTQAGLSSSAIRAAVPISPSEPAPRRRPASTGQETGSLGCVAIGISTGGPQTLTQVFSALDPPLPPIVVVQHMPQQFTGVFAQRLNRHSRIPVKEAESGDRVVPNQILIAPGAIHMSVEGRPGHARIVLGDFPPVSGHKPSVDVLFRSVADVYRASAVGIIMTGMGRDGVEGCKRILSVGGSTFGQDEESSIVYGMNKCAFEEHALTRQFALAEFVDLVQSLRI